MNEFQIAAVALVALIAPCVWVCSRRGFADGLVAAQLASTLGAIALLAIAMGELRQPFADLAIVLAAASLVGTLVLARFMEGNE